MTLSGCSSDEIVDCIGGGNTFVATLVARHGDSATFQVESKRSEVGSSHSRPVVRVGSRVTVHFLDDTGQFLVVGKHYSVNAWPRTSGFESDIHQAGKDCTDYTRYADGSAIDTSIWARSWQRNARDFVVVAVIVLLIVGLIVFGIVDARRRRGIGRGRDRLSR